LTNPTSSDSLSSPSHSAQHANVNDAVEALQAKVGVDSSAVTSSLDYKVAQLEGRDTAGLVHISRTTIGSAVSSVTVSDAFSADYDSYKIIIAGGAGSTALALRIALGATTTGYSRGEILTLYASPGVLVFGVVNGANWTVGRGNANALSANVEISSPFLTEYTRFTTTWANNDAFGHGGGELDNTTSYTAFTITTSTGTMTGGTIDVYGYAKA